MVIFLNQIPYILNQDIVQQIDLIIEERLLVDPSPKHETEPILNAYNEFSSDDINDLDDVSNDNLIKLQKYHMNLRWNEVSLETEEFQNYINEEELHAYHYNKDFVHNIDLVIKERLLVDTHLQYDTERLSIKKSYRFNKWN